MSKPTAKQLKGSILSLSLLTVMAAAGVAPALSAIRDYFWDVDQTLVQMIVSIPALFIILTSLIFPRLCRVLRTKQLLMIGLLLYTVCGTAAGACHNIWAIMIFRALLGVGVGIIMPLSTGLLTYYYDSSQQTKLMSLSSSLNQFGAVVAMLLSGFLCAVDWRCSFLVYLLGLISIVLVLRYLPSEQLANRESVREKGVFRRYYPFIVGVFLLMFAFFVYPSAFSMEAAGMGLTATQVPIIMAFMDFCSFMGALSFEPAYRKLGNVTRFFPHALMLVGCLLLALVGGLGAAVAGSVCVGFGYGFGLPYIMSSVGRRAGKMAATTVMPLISIALFLSQFANPFAQAATPLPPFLLGAVLAAIGLVWFSVTMREKK